MTGAKRYIALTGLWLIVCSPVVFAQSDVPPPDDPPPARPAAPLDDALLNDLDNQLLDGAGDLKRPGKPDQPAPAPADKGGAARPDGEVIDDTMPAEDVDPLVHISQEMRFVEELLPQSGKRPHAEQLQQRIVEDLARLIEQAESQQSQQSKSKSKSQQQQAKSKERKSVQQPQQAAGKSGQDSNQPAKDSTNRMGQAEAARPDPEMFKRMMKDAWGHLPQRDREQVLQNTPDKFLPQYELMIEKYFQRLADEPEAR